MEAMKTFELYDTETEQVIDTRKMTDDEAERKNAHLRAEGDSLRWVEQDPLESK